MEFANLDKVIDAFGASEKKIEKNYVQYLDLTFANWRKFQSETNKDKTEKVFFERGSKKKIFTEITDTKKQRLVRIDVFETNVEFPAYSLLLNRRENATIIRHYEQSSNLRSTDTYFDGYFNEYLRLQYDSNLNVKSYVFKHNGVSAAFNSEIELLGYVNSLESDGSNNDVMPLTVANLARNDSGISFELLDSSDTIENARLVKKDKEIAVLVRQLGNKVFVEIPYDELYNGTYDLNLSTASGQRLVMTQSLEHASVAERSYELAITEEKIVYLYINSQKHVTVVVMTRDSDNVKPVTTGGVVNVNNAVVIDDKLLLDLQLPGAKDVEFFQILKDEVVVLECQKVRDGIYLFDVNNYRSDSLIYVSFTNKNSYFQQREVSFRLLLNGFVKRTEIQKIRINEEGDMQFDFFMSTLDYPTGMILILRNRGSREFVKSYPNDVLELTSKVARVTYIISKNDLPLPQEFLLENYDPTIYDIEFGFNYKNLYEGAVSVKAKYGDKLEEEIFGKYTDDYDWLIYPYSTSKGSNLSLRTFFMKHDAAVFYQKQKQKLGIKDKATIPSGNKQVVAVIESPDRAQDNGLVFFKYLVDEHSDKFETRLILSESSPDWKNLVGYEENVLIYKSIAHFDYMTRANAVVHTNSSFYAYPVNTSFWNGYQLAAKKMFLQHGIIGVRDLAGLYGKNPMFTDRFIVSSQREKDIVTGKMRYDDSEVAITGLARFDNLLKNASDDQTFELRKKILIMPSWRKGEDRLTDDNFKKTEFYKNLTAFLNNQDFINLIKSRGLTVDLYLHHNFQKYNALFESEFVNVLSEQENTVQDLLMTHGLLITDFSSVALDFALQERKVFYYQLDDAILTEKTELSELFPGKIYWKVDELIGDIHDAIDNPKLSNQERHKLDRLYSQRDLHANDRIYKVMLSLLKPRKYIVPPKLFIKKVKRRIKKEIRKVID